MSANRTEPLTAKSADAPSRTGSIHSGGTTTTTTATAADAVATGANADVEKQPPKPTMPTFPEGSLQGWLTVAGAWLIMFVSFGMANTFGIFQSYYQLDAYPSVSASTISWIGSLQLFFQLSLGAVSGPLYDKGYFYHLVGAGSVLYIVCWFMLSLTHSIWEIFLSQALGIGIAIGILFLPAISVLAQYFHKRRALAMGIATTGSSTGGICLPIMLNNLIAKHGFEKAVQYTGYLILGCLVLAMALMRTRLPPAQKHEKPDMKALFTHKAYLLLIAGLFLISWGLFFPIFYLQVLAEQNGLPQNLVFYTLAILNAASVFGRLTPNLLADRFGPLNLLSIMSVCAGILCFSLFGATTSGGLIVIAILFGFFSGAYVSLLGPSLASMSSSHTEIGIRMGMGFVLGAPAALTGTPIAGALLDNYGQYAPITWSGVTVIAGGVVVALSGRLRAKEKGTQRV